MFYEVSTEEVVLVAHIKVDNFEQHNTVTYFLLVGPTILWIEATRNLGRAGAHFMLAQLIFLFNFTQKKFVFFFIAQIYAT